MKSILRFAGRGIPLIIVIVVLVAFTKAEAQPTATRFINLNVFSLTNESNYVHGDLPNFPHSGYKPSGGWFAGFTIPPDYATGTPLVIHLIWHTEVTNCNRNMAPYFMTVTRPGRTHIKGTIPTDGLSFVGGGTLHAPATANVSQETLVNITSPEPGTNLLPGDSINFGLQDGYDYPPPACPGDAAFSYRGHFCNLPGIYLLFAGDYEIISNNWGR